MHKPILILMARWPAPNRCKTRLSKSIGSVRAAAIQKHLNFHTISVAKRLEQKGLIELKISIDGIGPKRADKWGKNIGIQEISIQSIGCLGLRMRKEVLKVQKSKRVISQRAKRTTILIGTDLPTLCEFDIIKAIQKLKTNDLVLGPANDGGYWLIGLAGNRLEPLTAIVFDGIKWGSNSVLDSTISKAKMKGIKYELLKCKNDLDQLIDISPWYEPESTLS